MVKRSWRDGLPFISVPSASLGAGVWRARKGRKHVVKVLTKAAEEAMNNYKNDVAPVCLMDFWVRSVDTANKQAEANGEPPLEFSTYERMAEVMMDFLFASQVVAVKFGVREMWEFGAPGRGHGWATRQLTR